MLARYSSVAYTILQLHRLNSLHSPNYNGERLEDKTKHLSGFLPMDSDSTNVLIMVLALGFYPSLLPIDVLF